MKKLMLNFVFAATMLAGMMTLDSCRRDRWEQSDSDIAADNSLAEGIAEDAFKQADDAVENDFSAFKGEDMESLNGPCANITHDTAAKKVTIDFGSTNCLCNDGKQRRGKILVSYTGRKRIVNSSLNVTTDGYYVNDHKVDIDKTITNLGRNANGNIQWNVLVKSAKVILANNGGTISWACNRTHTWLKGEATPRFLADDQYEISGNASGVNAKGVAYTINITTPLLLDFSCNQARLVKGVVEITPNGKQARIIDYGNGTCDNQASITVGNTTKTFTMRTK